MPRDDGDALAPEGTAPGTFAAHALRLAELGYSPIPLDGKVPAKGKGSLGWPRRRDPDPGWIAQQVRACPGANVGIVCGRVVAVDIDVLDPDLAHRLDALAVARLGEGPLRIGRWPKRLRVYRLAEPLQKMVEGVEGAKVEVLACGQQFAAYGTHPDTGRPYAWPDGDLTDTALDDLPVASPDALRRFMAEVAALLPRREDAPARAKVRAAAAHGGVAAAHGGGGEIVRDADGRVVDGRDAHLSQLAFHAVWEAIARGAAPDEAAIAAAVWARFREDAALDNAKGSGCAWSERDALMKVRDKLRLHSEGRLPGREGDAPAARVPPFHPLPTAAAAEARAEVRRQVQGFLARTLDWHEAEAAERIKRQQAARAAAELAAQERDAQVGAELAAQLGTGTAALVAPEHAGLAVEVAAGKTTITCAALPGFAADAKARRLPDRVLFLVPTHKLGGEILGILEAQGLVAAAWRGRAATNPDTGQPMCANLDAVGDAIAVMQDVERTVCGKAGGPRCRFFDECPYQHQKAAAGLADVVVAAHETMLGQLPSAIGEGFAVVIADEGWWQDGLERARPLAAETLRAGEDAHPVPRLDDPDRRDDEATEQLHALRRKMAAAVEASPDGYLAREALLAAGLTAADCGAAVKLEWRRKVEDAMRPGMPEAARREAAERCAGNAAIPRLAALWKEAEALLDSEDEATGRVEFDTRDGAEGRRRMILLNTARPVAEVVAGLPMLLLDATLPERLLRHRLPGLQVLATVRAAAPHMRVHQVLGGFGKTTSLLPHREASEAENRRRERRIAALRRFIAARSGGERTLVVTYAELEPRFAGLPGVELAHFNALAGRDEWGPGPGREGVRHLFVVGRPLPAPEDVRRLAAALTGRPVPREQPGRVPRGATMRDGSGAAVAVRAYADPDLEAVRAAVTDAELVQAIGRGRGINRAEANPLDVWLLAGDAVVQLPVDELARWKDVAPAPGPRERMAERGVVLEGARDACAAYPDLFPAGAAALRQALMVEAREWGLCEFSLWTVSIGKTHTKPTTTPLRERVGNAGWVRVDYRPRGRGQQTRTAWAHPDRMPGLHAWLEAALGVELAVFRPVPEPPPPAPPRTVQVLELSPLKLSPPAAVLDPSKEVCPRAPPAKRAFSFGLDYYAFPAHAGASGILSPMFRLHLRLRTGSRQVARRMS